MKIYVNTPAGAVAGGVESLYQLVDAINNIGGDAVIYFDNPSNYIDDFIPQKYKHYNIKYSFNVEDTSDNWIIYHEVWTDKLDQFKNIKKAIWWLSVDNNHGKFKDFNNINITHFYQSYYALFYLLQNGAQCFLPLFDYIPFKYIEADYDIKTKTNIICYNPVKGKEITNKIKELNPNKIFVPLTNMNEDQIIDSLRLSKVYIDFGNHPGRDRIPREAAILGNCVITGFEGSSMFYNDIPISNKYKFTNLEEVGGCLEDIFYDFKSNYNNFSLYRSNILNQKEQMYNLCKQYFL